MAIKLLNDTVEALQAEINNGDLTALNEIIEKWRFKDKESALRFAIAVLSMTTAGTLCQEKEDGSRVKLAPTDNLINKS